IAALGIGTSATHMEWFFGPKGLKFSEIGCRPPGVGAWDLYSADNDMDVYRAWANAITRGETGSAPSRRYAAGIVALRPDREGQIATIAAGWQEREPYDSELGKLLVSRDVNLRLYRRWLDVQERDPEFDLGERKLAAALEELQDMYLLRLDHALRAVYEVQ